MVSRGPCSTRLGLSVFFTMNVIAFTMALWTTDVYGTSESAGNLAPVLNGLFRYLTLIFSATRASLARAAALRARLERAATRHPVDGMVAGLRSCRRIRDFVSLRLSRPRSGFTLKSAA